MKAFKLLCILGIASLTCLSCEEDALDSKSIFDTEQSSEEQLAERTPLDNWLDENFVKPYNIELKYRLDDDESDQKYNVTPADYDKSVALAKLIHYLWLEAYETVAGTTFIRSYAPKMMHFIGSPEFEGNGSIRLGVAEGGMKITLTNVNMIDEQNPDPIQLNDWYFRTMHHEFGHILHQTKDYPTEFEDISAGNYQGGGWVNITDEEALQMGFIRNYAASEPQEDFVEILSWYITTEPTVWERLMQQAGETGRPILEQKLEMVRNYMSNTWNIDLDQLQSEVLSRQANIGSLDLTL